MTKPIVFKPGDVLTADQINKYLVENDSGKITALTTQLQPIWKDIQTNLGSINTTLTKAEVYATGGRPVYDYEDI